jgi:hypothetical protein
LQGVALRQGVELTDKVVGAYHLPNFHMALDHAPVDAKREAFLLLGADVARERDQFSARAGNGGDSPHRPDFGGRLGLVAGTQESQA